MERKSKRGKETGVQYFLINSTMHCSETAPNWINFRRDSKGVWGPNLVSTSTHSQTISRRPEIMMVSPRDSLGPKYWGVELSVCRMFLTQMNSKGRGLSLTQKAEIALAPQ